MNWLMMRLEDILNYPSFFWVFFWIFYFSIKNERMCSFLLRS